MNITVEERMMYEVMRALYVSGIPVSFKGSMVLKACLSEAGLTDDTRHTVDIDANWNSETYPTMDQIAESLQSALDSSGLRLSVRPYRTYAEGRSAGFEMTDPDTEETLFTMDIDVNRPEVLTRIYEIAGFRFRGVSPSVMIADKILVISTEKIFRRIKDVIDLYYISMVFKPDYASVIGHWKGSNRRPGNFDGFLHKQEELRHSYEKFRFSGDVNKPDFARVYDAVKSFISPFLSL